MSDAPSMAGLVEAGLVSDDPSDLQDHSYDWASAAFVRRRLEGSRALASIVLRPKSTADVATIMEWAQASTTPVVPFGGGSGVCGAIAPEGGAVVDLTEMDRVIDVDERSRLVRVQAGILGPDLATFLGERDWMLGHEPQSLALSTVGGWIATRACGQLSARYGGIEQLVAGLEAVLPGGVVTRTKAVPRRSAGPEVAELMIGSEGTLGIVTEATLRISPLPGTRFDLATRFEHMGDGVAAARALAQSRLDPTLVRLYDREDAALFLRNLDDPPTGPLLLVSFDGFEPERRLRAARDLVQGEPLDAGLVEHWWRHRNDAVDAYRSEMSGSGILGRHALIDTIEVAGTWAILRDLYHSMKEALSGEADLAGCHLSHVYPDGACLYFTLASACGSDEQALAADERWWEVAMGTALAAGGSISHHHGIGRLKARWLPEELGEWWAVLRAVKGAVDPAGIMNPGALGL